MSEITKLIDERETPKKKRQKGTKGTEAIGKVWELNDFVVHLN